MRWTSSDLRFARPIRWLVALFGADVLEIEVDGVRAGRETRGIRFHRDGPFAVEGADGYLRVLAENGVVLEATERRRQIESALVSAASEAGGRLVPDPDLLVEVAYLVAWPSVITGSFDAKFLALPRDDLAAGAQVLDEHVDHRDEQEDDDD